MADVYESGDFPKLLAADLDQITGNLFFTFFPHESYWSDNMKYPWMFEIGIRDKELTSAALENAEGFQWLESHTAETINSVGVEYEARLMSEEDFAKSAELVWVLRTGGFLWAFRYGDVAGHDYPKRPYPGITGHRNVVLLDALKTSNKSEIVDRVFGSEYAKYLSFEGKSNAVLWHEATHGVGIRALTMTASGKTFGDVFGDYWGMHSEPYADVGGVLIMHHLFEIGKITEQEFKEGLMSFMAYELTAFNPKEDALDETYQKEDPHGTGASLAVGWMFQKGAVYKNDETGFYEVNWETIIDVLSEFYDRMTPFAALGDLAGFKDFIVECVEGVPAEIDAIKIEMNKENVHSVSLINRGALYHME